MNSKQLMLGFVLGLLVSAGLAWAQGYPANPYGNPYGNRVPFGGITPTDQEYLLNSQSILRDGGVGYQRSFAPLPNPC